MLAKVFPGRAISQDAFVGIKNTVNRLFLANRLLTPNNDPHREGGHSI